MQRPSKSTLYVCILSVLRNIVSFQVENSSHQQPAPRKQQPGERSKDEDFNVIDNSSSVKQTPRVNHEEEERQRRVISVSSQSKQGVGLGLSVQEPGSSATLEHKSLVSLNDMNLTVDFDNDEDKERAETNNPNLSKFTGPSLPLGPGGESANSEDARRLSGGKEGAGSAASQANKAGQSKRGSNPILWAQQRIQKGMGNKGAPVMAVLPEGTSFVASSQFAGYRENFDFKTGDQGTGYYPSPKPVSLPSNKFATHKLSEHQEPSNRNFESPSDLKKHRDALRTAATKHLNDLVEDFVRGAPLLSRDPEVALKWKEIVVSLCHQVVASVDPDVRRQGDQLDVTHYVKV